MSEISRPPPVSEEPVPGEPQGQHALASGEAPRGHTKESARVLAELKKQAEVLRVLQDTLPVIVWVIDDQGIIIHSEGSGLSAAGIQAHIGENILDVYGNLEGTAAVIQRALKGEPSQRLAVALGFHWQTWIIPVKDEQGKVTSVVGISLDVSEAKRTEQMLREKLALIERQEAAIRALSTPIIEVWDRVLTMPLLGVLDSGRGAAVMENLLVEVSRKRASFAILDLTGVEAVDTSTANHLIKLIQSIRLLGAEGVITGIQPSVAQTMVTLGMDLGAIATLATLRDGLRHCIARMSEGGAEQGSALGKGRGG